MFSYKNMKQKLNEHRRNEKSQHATAEKRSFFFKYLVVGTYGKTNVGTYCYFTLTNDNIKTETKHIVNCV